MKIFISISRNIYNVRMIDRYINSQLTDRANVDKWINTTLRRFIINEAPVVKMKPEDLEVDDPDWAKVAVQKDELYRIPWSSGAFVRFTQDIEHAIGWLKTFPVTKSINVSAQEAIRQGNLYIEQQNKKAESGDGDIEQLHIFRDGYSIVSCLDTQSLKREGKLMQHCVGNEQQQYITKVSNGSLEIWSLRDKQNNPHCTIEYDPRHKTVLQIKGKQNKGVIQKYQHYVVEWLQKAKNQSLIKDFNPNDLQNIGILDQDGIWYDLFSLPKGFVFTKAFEINDENIHLPENVRVEGSLAVLVHGDMRHIDYKLPDNLTVEGSLFMHFSVADRLSSVKNLSVGDTLYLANTHLSHLPSDLNVNELVLANTNIEQIPESIKVKRILVDTRDIDVPEKFKSIVKYKNNESLLEIGEDHYMDVFAHEDYADEDDEDDIYD